MKLDKRAHFVVTNKSVLPYSLSDDIMTINIDYKKGFRQAYVPNISGVLFGTVGSGIILAHEETNSGILVHNAARQDKTNNNIEHNTDPILSGGQLNSAKIGGGSGPGTSSYDFWTYINFPTLSGSYWDNKTITSIVCTATSYYYQGTAAAGTISEWGIYENIDMVNPPFAWNDPSESGRRPWLDDFTHDGGDGSRASFLTSYSGIPYDDSGSIDPDMTVTFPSTTGFVDYVNRVKTEENNYEKGLMISIMYGAQDALTGGYDVLTSFEVTYIENIIYRSNVIEIGTFITDEFGKATVTFDTNNIGDRSINTCKMWASGYHPTWNIDLNSNMARADFINKPGEIDGIQLDGGTCDNIEILNSRITHEVYDGMRPLEHTVIDTDDYTITGSGSGEYDITKDGYNIYVSGDYIVRLDYDVTIEDTSVLLFEFNSINSGYMHGIGFSNISGFVFDSGQIFQLYGTNTINTNVIDSYDGSGLYKKYNIPIGQYYTGVYDSIKFIIDNPLDEYIESNFRYITVMTSGAFYNDVFDDDYTIIDREGV